MIFTDFHVDPGSDILVTCRGDQQYAIPDHVDLRRHDTVLLWCRAFSVRIAGADLARAT